jgi:ribose transport system ATP-binding protein
VRIANDVVTKMTPRHAIDCRMAFITENRREEGLMMNAAIAENIALATLPTFSLTPLRLIDSERMLDAVTGIATALHIKSGPVSSQPVKSLSGGNQQKVVIAKWLLTAPSIFILDEPTRGIDVAAKYEIYSMINQLAANGSGVLFISSEIEEAMAMCDRIMVMSRGEIVGEFDRVVFNKEAILRAAFREQENAA